METPTVRALFRFADSRRLLGLITFVVMLTVVVYLLRVQSLPGFRDSTSKNTVTRPLAPNSIANLANNGEGYYGGTSAVNDSLTRQFAPTLTTEQQATILETLNVLVNLLESARIPYYLCGGTLLGSYRHHGLIPWDDDIDVCIWKHDQPKVKNVSLQAWPAYALVVPSDQDRWKFFANSSTATVKVGRKNYGWRAPFVDVWPVAEQKDGEYIVERLEKYVPRTKKSTVFPLSWRPFAGNIYRVPRDTHGYLSLYYNLQDCSSNKWSHVMESASGKSYLTECGLLYHKYPFVFRRPSIDSCRPGVLEALVLDGIVLSAVTVDEHASLPQR